jgi:hypothetical protein
VNRVSRVIEVSRVAKATRLAAAFALIAIVAIAPACRTKKKARGAVIEDDGQLSSVVSVADPHAAIQLVRGFHPIENDAWRWTMKNFTVTLRPPARSAQGGAQLELKFNFPAVIFDRVGPIALSARVGGLDLAPETYSQAGDATYTRDIPGSALGGEAVSFDFAVSKAIPPSDKDGRELAIIVTTIGLTPK